MIKLINLQNIETDFSNNVRWVLLAIYEDCAAFENYEIIEQKMKQVKRNINVN